MASLGSTSASDPSDVPRSAGPEGFSGGVPSSDAAGTDHTEPGEETGAHPTDQEGTPGAARVRKRPLAAVRAALARARDWIGHRWRTSLQFRTVAITVVLGAVVTVLLQSFSYSRTAATLVEGKVQSAQEDASSRANAMQERLDSTDRTDPDTLLAFTYDLMEQQRSNEPDQLRELILTPSSTVAASPDAIPTMWTSYPADQVPEQLRQAVAEDPTHQKVQIVPVSEPDAEPTPSVIVGQQIRMPDDSSYELYFVYAMKRESDTMALMLRTYILGGILLTGLIGLVSLAVTRLVVDPVQEAARVAERLSNGRLEERMQARGEDDIARLSGAFNTMADNLQNQIRRLEDVSAVQQRFVADVSHELRTPLTTIQMASEMIHAEKDSFSPPVKRSAELLYSEVERFDEMLAGLLEISRHDAGSVVLETESQDLMSIIDRVVEAAAPLADTKGSTVTVVERTPGPFDAEVDHRRIERILRNLLVNALEHGQGKPIEIEVAAAEDVVAVAVRDHGIGLERGQASMVFNRFWRADPARNRTTGGTGLGLSIALEDARLHRGMLQAWGVPGEGSRFRLTLPRTVTSVVTEPPLPLTDAGSEASPQDTGPLRIIDSNGPGATTFPVNEHEQADA